MSDNQSNNKRIAKNTMFLYVRMLLTVFVGFFTSRIVINALGVSDYGINNVVAGVISLLGYVTGVMSGCTSRFLMVGLGEGNALKLKRIFTGCFTLHFLTAILIFIIGETVGVWFVNNQLNIDADRMVAANWIYQFALFSAMVSFIQAPFQASIISHEKMNVYAYMSIYDVVAKLLVALLLLYVNTDKLILYGGTYLLVNISSILIYNWYCRKHFDECSFKLGFDKALYKELGSYMGWNLTGSLAYIVNEQGFNILLNRFFSTVVNGARGIAGFVSGTLQKFVSNFQTAARPQVMQYCAQKKYNEMQDLIINNAKYSSYICIITALPAFWETDFLIHLWLGNLPQYASVFLKLTLVQMLLSSMVNPMQDGILAVGKMKWPNILGVTYYLGLLFLIFVVLKNGANPVGAYIVYMLVTPIIFVVNIVQLHFYIGLSIFKYIKKVIIKSLLIIFLSSIIPFFITQYLPEDWLRFIYTTISCSLCSGILILFWGVSKNVRKNIRNSILGRFKR